MCTISDPKVGVNEPVTLASGASKVVNVDDFEIPADAADPFPNEATATCSPQGFPNVLVKKASHNVELFQPSITLTKEGDALSKIGDEVTTRSRTLRRTPTSPLLTMGPIPVASTSR